MYLKPKSSGIATNTHVQLGVITPAAVWKNAGSTEALLVHLQNGGFWLSVQHLNQTSDLTDWF